MSGPGAALRELGEGTAWETETLGCETVWGVPGKARRPCGWSGNPRRRKLRKVGCWVGEEARVL